MFVILIFINGKEIRVKILFCKEKELCKYFGMFMVYKRGRVLNVMREMCENRFRGRVVWKSF